MDTIKGSIQTNTRLFPGRFVESLIDSDFDQDWFYFTLIPDLQYELSLRSIGPDPLPSPLVRLLSEKGELIESGTLNSAGNLSKLQFKATMESRYHFAALNRGPGTGRYQISLRSLQDDLPNNISGSGNIQLSEDKGIAKGIIEQFGDQDWIKIKLKPETWYHLYFNPSYGSQAFFLRSQTGQQLSVLSTNDRFYSDTGGSRYLVVRQNRSKPTTGQYELNIEGGQPPFLSTVLGQSNQPIGLAAWLKTNEFPVSHYHIYSDDDLGFGNPAFEYRVQPAGRIYRASNLNLRRWRTLADSKATSNVYVRGLESKSGDGFVTPWVKINVASRNARPLLSGRRWRPNPSDIKVLQYSFAEALPSYFEGDNRFGQFMSLDEGMRQSMREAIRRWDQVEASLQFEEVAPNPSNDNAEFMIFSANLNAPVTGFLPGQAGGSDIVLNPDAAVLDDLNYGSRGFFELLRGVGSALGLSANNDYDRNQSVMGRYVDPANFNAIYPTSPAPLDISALTDNHDRFLYKKDRTRRLGNSSYRFIDGLGDTVEDFGGIDQIDGTGDLAVEIDLTPGATSFQIANQTKVSSISISFDSRIEYAKGGSRNDRLAGNGFDNRLEGNEGRDWLNGRVGNDLLLGGKGNDTYYYEMGDGFDTIDETAGNGRDQLQIKGFFTFNDFTKDLAFQRVNSGKDLLVRLSLDEDDQNDQGTILIKNMNRRRAQVESLSVSNQRRDIARVNLMDLFSQTDNQLTRFKLAEQSDSFGQLVFPV